MNTQKFSSPMYLLIGLVILMAIMAYRYHMFGGGTFVIGAFLALIATVPFLGSYIYSSFRNA